MKRNTAVTYHRVSTLDQDPTLAREELRRAAAARSLSILEEIEETGSGARANRPGLERVLELVRRHQVDHVLCWKLDRFGRSSLDILHQIQAIELAGGTFVATSQGIEVGRGAGPMGRLVLQVMSAIAEFERTVTIERSLLGIAAAKARGVHCGRPAGAKDRQRRRRRGGTA